MSTLLNDALHYLARGLPPVPMKMNGGTKKPATAYKRFEAELPSEEWVREAFARRGVNGVAVLPKLSGLAIRDFDDTPGYDRWSDENPALARTLPTVQTKRGRHVWCQSDLAKIVKLADGEYRGAGLTVAPRSLRDGFTYQWIIPLPAGPLPFVPSESFTGKSVTESTESTETAEKTERMASVHSVSSVLSVTSPDGIITATLPTKPGERNACLLNLARGLKFNASLMNADTDTLRGIVRRWHNQAVPIIATKDFDSSWADFIHAFEGAKHPLGLDLVDAAALRVDPNELPEVAENYDGLATRRLIGLCAALASLGGGGRFFLSAHDAAPRLDITPMQAWRLLRMLERDGVLECLERGNERRATRYRWIGGKAETDE